MESESVRCELHKLHADCGGNASSSMQGVDGVGDLTLTPARLRTCSSPRPRSRPVTNRCVSWTVLGPQGWYRQASSVEAHSWIDAQSAD